MCGPCRADLDRDRSWETFLVQKTREQGPEAEQWQRNGSNGPSDLEKVAVARLGMRNESGERENRYNLSEGAGGCKIPQGADESAGRQVRCQHSGEGEGRQGLGWAGLRATQDCLGQASFCIFLLLSHLLLGK